MKKVFQKIHKGLIVSCQAEGDSPFNNPEDVAKFALCAQRGGATAIRTEGIEKVKAIRKILYLPIIGIVKSYFEDGFVKITGSEKDVKNLIEVGCDIIAIDGTFRKRDGFNGPDFIEYIKKNYDICIMADIADIKQANACVEAGADCISTTLNGYTPETNNADLNKPNLQLLKKLVQIFENKIPVIAEGRYNSPQMAKKAIDLGAWAVVTGTAITRPQTITKWFYDEIKK